jgi:uncharacterized protein (TIGR00661 family)
MAKVIFGLSGDGRGHGSRSKITIAHLLNSGHEVKVVSSGKGYEYLSDYYQVVRICGLRVVSDSGKVDAWKTVKETFDKLSNQGMETFRTLLREVDSFKPDIIISDFEPFTSVIGAFKRIPLISIDNQHVITLCNLRYPRSWLTEYIMAWTICETICGFADYYFITSFFTAPLRKVFRHKAIQVGLILRNEVLEQKTSTGKHILIYIRTPERAQELLPHIEEIDTCRYIAYGFKENCSSKKHIIFKYTSEEFLHDLAASKAVITNGGHSLISEALYLGKPIFSIPTRRDFEQMINAYHVEKLGYGKYDFSPSVMDIQAFINNLDSYEQHIERDKTQFNGNNRFFELLDAKIEELCTRRLRSVRSPVHLNA